jgi:hypothetical protein
MTVDRMKRRHPNIHNEILIEKRVRPPPLPAPLSSPPRLSTNWTTQTSSLSSRLSKTMVLFITKWNSWKGEKFGPSSKMRKLRPLWDAIHHSPNFGLLRRLMLWNTCTSTALSSPPSFAHPVPCDDYLGMELFIVMSSLRI